MVAGQPWSVGSVNAPKCRGAGRAALCAETACASSSGLRNARGRGRQAGIGEPATKSAGRSAVRSRSSELAMTGWPQGVKREDAEGARRRLPNAATALGSRFRRNRSSAAMRIGRRCLEGRRRRIAHYAQTTGSRSRDPLGRTASVTLTAAPCCHGRSGYDERLRGGAEARTTKQTYGSEYLLYHRTEGFRFIVDAQGGWRWTARSPARPKRPAANLKVPGRTYRKCRLHRMVTTCSDEVTAGHAQPRHCPATIRAPVRVGHERRTRGWNGGTDAQAERSEVSGRRPTRFAETKV